MASFRSRTLTEYAQIIWRRKLLIFLIAVGMLISTFLMIERLPNVYESQASVVIAGLQNDRQTVNSRVAATTERLTSRAFLEPVVQQQNPYGTASGNLDGAIARMRQDIKVDTTYRSDFPERITVTYRHSDPTVAKSVLTDLISAFDNMNQAMEKQLSEQSSSLASEIASVENRLRDMGKLRSAIAMRSSAGGRAASEVSAIRAQRLAVASSIETLTDKRFALEQQIAEQQRQIAEQQKIVKQAPSDTRASGSYGVLLVRKAELEGQLKDYATQYTDKNPKVIQARNQLAEINHQMAQLNAGGEQGGAINSAEARELRAMQRELARMQTELAITERELERKKRSAPDSSSVMPSVAAISAPAAVSAAGNDTPVQADYETLRNRYDRLLSRQEQLERTQVSTAGLDPGVFQIVDMPAEPRVPIGPNRFKYRMFALALALGVALLVALAIELPKLYAITDDRDVEYYLGVRVIALIPETIAPARPEPRRLLPGRATGALLVTVLLFGILLLLKYPQVFKVLLQ